MNVIVYAIWPTEIGNDAAQGPQPFQGLSYGSTGTSTPYVIQLVTMQQIGTHPDVG